MYVCHILHAISLLVVYCYFFNNFLKTKSEVDEPNDIEL